MFVEAQDREIFAGIASLEALAAKLPSAEIITPADVASAFSAVTKRNFKIDNVYRWIEAGCFEYLDVGTGTEKRRYQINRRSFFEFLKSRVNRI